MKTHFLIKTVFSHIVTIFGSFLLLIFTKLNTIKLHLGGSSIKTQCLSINYSSYLRL
jgi:hypothetical protein